MKEILNKWHLGVNFGFRAKNGYFSSDAAKKEARDIVAAGADWVVLVVTVYQEHFYSTVQFMDFEKTPNDIEVMEMIDYLHSIGLKVQLRPMLETLDGEGRLSICFPNDDPTGIRVPGTSRTYWADWFESMTKRSIHYAKIAEKTKCEMYCLDSELDYSVPQNNHWKTVVSEVRKHYTGCLTTCMTTSFNRVNFEAAFENPDHWFHDLDLLTLSTYENAADKPGTSKEEMKEWLKPLRERFSNFYQLYQKPLLFGECGCSATEGAAMSPSWYAFEHDYDGQEQANYMSALIETFANEPWWYGLYLWKWEEHIQRPTDPTGIKGFTIKGKPAEEVYRYWGKQDRSRN